MEKKELGIFERYGKFMEDLSSPGALLAVVDNEGRPNVMTIGWCSIGRIWGKPICTVMVRSSRHSFTCLEAVRQFTVNAGGVSSKAVEICGSISGREQDKFKAAEITAVKGLKVKAPVVGECSLHYECNVVHYHDFEPMNMVRGLKDTFYIKGDYHRVYYGEIAACYGN
jgi:flavin reductase (DIM6/NTAB) family NADH-FMN oxidoreductase RutF